MPSALSILQLGAGPGESLPGFVAVAGARKLDRIDEEVALSHASSLGDIDYVLFRRFTDGRSSQVAAYVIENSDDRFDENQLAKIHLKLWLDASAPLLYVGWQTRVDILCCARGPDFWKAGSVQYAPEEQINTAVLVSSALEKQRRRFSAFRLSDGTFWDDPANARLANSDKAAHRRLINAVVETDKELDGENNPLLRRLLLLMVLIKYLEDREVFPAGWFAQCRTGATTFFDVLQQGTPDEVRELLGRLERKFNGDVFALPEDTKHKLTQKELCRFAELIEARTIKAQRYLWEQFSFRYIPVEVLSHLYQRFAQRDKGAVFTPPFVASLMLDYALPYEKIDDRQKVLDPTCGSGIFLVGAFRRLIHYWRSQNKWEQPDVATLKGILKRSIFGVELQPEAAHLTAFSLALAVCDALQPNVIWKDLRFDKLADTNLLCGDFFEHLPVLRRKCETEPFTVVLGNPPFMSKFSAAAATLNGVKQDGRVSVPDKQMAYLIAEQVRSLMAPGARMCLIQPAGFLYNEKVRPFQKYFLRHSQVDAVLDFTSIRGLYDGADPKTVALVVTNARPAEKHIIRHYTFRRTFSVLERIAFELDHYDRHPTYQEAVLTHPWIWRVNLLGGGRLLILAARLKEMPTLGDFIRRAGWNAGEGFIAGVKSARKPAKWLTGKRLLPTEALTTKGIDASSLAIVTDREFAAPRTEERYQAPLVLIKEHESLPCAFWNDGFIAYKDQVVGIHAPATDAEKLRLFSTRFNENRSALRAFCQLFGTKALVGKATAIVKRDLDALPWPTSTDDWKLSRWEKILCEDAVDRMAEFVRLGQESQLLKKRATAADLRSYAGIFVEMLGSIHPNLRAAKSDFVDGLAYQAFSFGNEVELEWPDNWTDSIRKLIYFDHSEALRTVRLVKFYARNVILVIKPDRLRYWIGSTAVRDSDETLRDLRKQGY
jgi:hypothetical protein